MFRDVSKRFALTFWQAVRPELFFWSWRVYGCELRLNKKAKRGIVMVEELKEPVASLKEDIMNVWGRL